jgi:acyl-CoA thioesterase FadM
MLKQQALRGEEPMAIALVQAACIDCNSFKPAPIPASLAERLAA